MRPWERGHRVGLTWVRFARWRAAKAELNLNSDPTGAGAAPVESSGRPEEAGSYIHEAGPSRVML